MARGVRAVMFVFLGALVIAASGYAVLPDAFESAKAYWLQDDPVVTAEYRLKKVAKSEYERLIDKALSESDFELATSLKSLAEDQGIDLPAGIIAKIDNSTPNESTIRDVWVGATTGKAESWPGFAAATLSDFLVIGDIRDLIQQATAYPDYDPVVVALAGTGVVLTGVTAATIAASFLTGGVAAPSVAMVAPEKVGVSILKTAKKMRKLSPRLEGDLMQIASKAIDKDALNSLPTLARKLDWDGFIRAGKKVVRREAIDQLADSAKSLGTIAKSQGYRATIQTLETAQSTREIGRVGKLSEKFPKGFRGLLALGVATGGLLVSMVAWTASGLLWLLGAAYFVFRVARFTLRLVKPRPKAIAS
ncbi:hypothetical protein NKJ86_14015 [Mesorhizobium sp. M0025]|uniref:hypothetical protein n=1 Tax=Mesorhizobium sp. M0025 TaxID=2956846 RepID=UPI00333AAA6C